MDTDTKRVLDVREAAAILHWSTDKIYRHLYLNIMPGGFRHKDGRWYIRLSELEQWIQGRTKSA